MSRIIPMAFRFAVAAIAGAGCLLVSEQALLHRDSALVTSADARIGRPLTPMSYAGVARRTTRRAVTYGAAAGAVAYGATVVAPVVVAPAPVYVVPGRCVQAVDPYGRVYTRCY
ncbi:MAG: hypothetical protein JWL86_3925 [Rhizobium sp.]|nr:hypothetical protein [Rhizobium sp.]